MQKIIIVLILIMSVNSYCQDTEYYRIKKNTKTVTITPHDNGTIIMYKLTGLFDNARKVYYNDTINNYRVLVPKWMELQETNNLYIFGSTIPREDGVDNAICINSATKNDFNSITDFKTRIIENPNYLIENDSTWIMGKEFTLKSFKKELLEEYESYKVEFTRKEKNYLGQFILLETKKAFLWINFIADENTYKSDFKKFKKFIRKFELLD